MGTANWNNGTLAGAGAATRCDGNVGCTGYISLANSLTGAHSGDAVSSGGIVAVGNGDYAVASPAWINAGLLFAGAVTLCKGASSCAGATVGLGNSLVGTHAYDEVGYGSPTVTPLPNGNYVVSSMYWGQGKPVGDAIGAATWQSTATPGNGAVSVANSFVGTAASGGNPTSAVRAFADSRYVVYTPDWANGRRSALER